jgi:hypothetical protein
MLKTTNIPDTALPSELDPENAIRIEYKTNLFAPGLGPLQLSYGTFGVMSTLADLVGSLGLIGEITKYFKAYAPIVLTKPDPPVRYIELQQMQRLDDYTRNLVNPADQQAQLIKNSLVTKLNEIQDAVRGVSSRTDLAPRFTPELISSPIGREAGYFAALGFPTQIAQLDTEFRAQDQVQSFLEELAMPSLAKRNFYEAGIFQADGPLLPDALLDLDAKAQAKTIVQTLTQGVARQEVSDQEKSLVAYALSTIVANTQLDWMAQELVDDANFATHLTKYALKGPGKVVEPFDRELDPNREWGIQRFEEMRLKLGQPFFRGPVTAYSVSPQSRLSLTETIVQEDEVAAAFLKTQQASSTYGEAAISASQFQKGLENLSEYGITDANAFSSTSTLFSTLVDERRSLVQQTARTISEENEQRIISRTSRQVGQTREYVTEGKDDNLATTEVGFQVVVPAQASVRLKDVGLIWSPYVIQPFIALRQSIDEHRRNSEISYRQQYYVPHPFKPPVNAVRVREEFYEIAVLEHKSYGTYGPNVIPINQKLNLYGNTFADISEIRIQARGAIYSFGEPNDIDSNNYMTLRNLAISDGGILTGDCIVEIKYEAVFSSKIYIQVPIYEYDEPTAAALRQYEASLADASLQTQSINARAVQFGQLKAQELIRQYENEIDLKQEVFRQAIAMINSLLPSAQRLYYENLLSSCILWSESSMELASAELNALYYQDLAPDHFLNSPAARLFLPIKRNAEETFLKTLEQMVDEKTTIVADGTLYGQAKKILESVENYRKEIKRLQEEDPEGLTLDEFDTEMVIGQHLEAVLSRFAFRSDPQA